MTEKHHQDRIVAAARERGWRASHDPDSRGQEAGEPDLTFLWMGEGLCPGPAPHFEAELKIRGHHRNDAQRRYANARVLHGGTVVEWRLPEDYDQVEMALGLERGALTNTPCDVVPLRRRGATDLVDLARAYGLRPADLAGYPPRVIEGMRRQRHVGRLPRDEGEKGV